MFYFWLGLPEAVCHVCGNAFQIRFILCAQGECDLSEFKTHSGSRRLSDSISDFDIGDHVRGRIVYYAISSTTYIGILIGQVF